MLNASAQTAINILLVDDHPIVRLGVSQLLELEPDLRVRWQASDIDEALAVCESAEPDMAIVDISLGQDSGVELIKKLTRLRPAMQILAMSMHDESHYAERALRAGAKGYVMKHSAAKNIVVALRRIRAGEIHVSEAIRARLESRDMAGEEGAIPSGLSLLSDRELEVFRLIGQGFKKGDLAVRLKVSVNTIESHRTRLKRKLKVSSSAELVRLAVLHFEGGRGG